MAKFIREDRLDEYIKDEEEFVYKKPKKQKKFKDQEDKERKLKDK